MDHFFPLTLQTRTTKDLNLNGVWNLVLACKTCNRRNEIEGGKFAKVIDQKYLFRLYKHMILYHRIPYINTQFECFYFIIK